MDFQISDDRRMLADTLSRFLAKQYNISHRNAVAYDAPFHDPARWTALTELGALYALVGEDQGGMGGSGFDITCVFQELGRALCPEPVLGTLMAARLLANANEPLDDLLSGTTRFAVAIGEPDAPYDLADLSCEAKHSGDAWSLTGRKSVVYGGGSADRILIAARHNGQLGLFETTEAKVTAYAMIDGGGAADLFLDDTPTRPVLTDAQASLDDALQAGALALCAEAIGAMDTTHAMLLDYLKTRQQFGRPIGSFQALQHRMVDLGIEIEQARSITILAASRLGGEGSARAISMAKNLVGKTARLVSEEAIQMHGGIAMTWEHPVSHYAKRLVMLDHQLGDADFHLEQVILAYTA